MLYVNARLLKQYGRKVKEGTVLCREGEGGNHMFIATCYPDLGHF